MCKGWRCVSVGVGVGVQDGGVGVSQEETG